MSTSQKWLSIVAGAVYTILAIYLLFNPGVNLWGMSYLIAFSVFVGGITEIIAYFALNRDVRDGWSLVSGIVTLLAGLVLLSGAFVTIPVVLPMILGGWLLVFGLIRLIRAFRVRDHFPLISNALLWSGLLGILFGLLLFFHPVFTSVLAATVISISFLYQGVTMLVDGFKK